MKSPVKRVPKEKVAILHHCTERERLARIEVILVGNGHPEEGYVFKVMEMGREITEIKDHLTGISGIVKDLHEESVGVKAVLKTQAEKKVNWINMAMLIVATIGMIVTAIFSYKGNEQSKINTNKIDNFGTPVIVNPRGLIVPLPAGDSLKFFRDMEFKDNYKDTIP